MKVVFVAMLFTLVGCLESNYRSQGPTFNDLQQEVLRLSENKVELEECKQTAKDNQEMYESVFTTIAAANFKLSLAEKENKRFKLYIKTLEKRLKSVSSKDEIEAIGKVSGLVMNHKDNKWYDPCDYVNGGCTSDPHGSKRIIIHTLPEEHIYNYKKGN